MTANSMASGWYCAKSGDPGGQPTGPLTWEQFCVLSWGGTLAPDDLVWHETYPAWIPAAQVPGLFPTVAPPAAQGPYPASAQAGAAYGPTAEPTAARSSGRRHSWLYWVVPLVVLVLAGAGLGVYFGFLRGGDDTSPTASGGTGREITAVSGVTLRCPVGWSWQTDGDAGGLTVAERQDDLTAQHPAGARLVLEAVGAASSDMTSVLGDVLPSGADPAAVAGSLTVVEDAAKTQVGGQQAVSITLRDDSTNPPLVTRYVIVELEGGGVFLFTLEAPADQWADKRSQLETLLQSAGFPTPAS